MDKAVKLADRVIIGIDPGTNVMGYAILGVYSGKPAMIAMGTVELHKLGDVYLRLGRIYERTTSLITQFCPDEMAIEAPFFGKNVQSMLKLGRAQGVAIAAAIARGITVAEYEPRKIKQAITGNGAAAKEQVSEMLRRILNLRADQMPDRLDATDALGAALCHFYESSRPQVPKGPSSWKEYITRNPDKVKGL